MWGGAETKKEQGTVKMEEAKIKEAGEFIKSSRKHTCLLMTHCFGVRRDEEGREGFSAQLVYMIHLTELSSLHCTNTCLQYFLFRVKGSAIADQHYLFNNKQVSVDAIPHIVLHQGTNSMLYYG